MLNLQRWWPWMSRPRTPLTVDHRPELAATMCPQCAGRWLRGRSIWHPWCAVELRHAFDLYFERLR